MPVPDSIRNLDLRSADAKSEAEMEELMPWDWPEFPPRVAKFIEEGIKHIEICPWEAGTWALTREVPVG